jgi:hypothetical protein
MDQTPDGGAAVDTVEAGPAPKPSATDALPVYKHADLEGHDGVVMSARFTYNGK